MVREPLLMNMLQDSSGQSSALCDIDVAQLRASDHEWCEALNLFSVNVIFRYAIKLLATIATIVQASACHLLLSSRQICQTIAKMVHHSNLHRRDPFTMPLICSNTFSIWVESSLLASNGSPNASCTLCHTSNLIGHWRNRWAGLSSSFSHNRQQSGGGSPQPLIRSKVLR